MSRNHWKPRKTLAHYLSCCAHFRLACRTLRVDEFEFVTRRKVGKRMPQDLKERKAVWKWMRENRPKGWNDPMSYPDIAYASGGESTSHSTIIDAIGKRDGWKLAESA